MARLTRRPHVFRGIPLERVAGLSLASAFGDTLSTGEIRRLARRCALSNFLRQMDHRDFARGARAHREIHGSVLDALAAGGQGAILAAVHLGPYLYVARPLLERGLHVVAIVDDEALETQQVLWEKEAAKIPGRLELMPLHGARSLLRALRALREGAVVVIFVDGGAGVAGPAARAGSQIEVTFCSMPVRMRTGATYLAQRAQVPLFLAAAHRDGWGRRVVEYSDPVPPPRRDDPEGAENLLRSVLPWFERRILAHPDQWVGWLLPVLTWASTGAAPRATRETLEHTRARVRELLDDPRARARLNADPVRVGAVESREDRVLVDGPRRLVLVATPLGVRILDAAQRRTRLADLPRRVSPDRAALEFEVTRMVLAGLATIEEPDRA